MSLKLLDVNFSSLGNGTYTDRLFVIICCSKPGYGKMFTLGEVAPAVFVEGCTFNNGIDKISFCLSIFSVIDEVGLYFIRSDKYH